MLRVEATLIRIRILSFAALTLLAPALTWAQDAPSGATQSSSGAVPVAKAGAVGGALTSIGGSDSDAAATSSAPPLQQLGHGSWLTPSLSPLHWGSLYVGSAEVLEGYQDIRFTGLPKDILRTTLFGTNVVYDTSIRQNHLALQWQPQIAIVNGQVLNNLNNENLGAAYATALTPRLTLGLHDQLAYVPINNIFSNNIFSPATVASLQSVQNPFLQGPGAWLTNTATLSVGYQLSERTSLTVAPSYVYVRSYGPTSSEFPGSKQYGGSASLNYQLSETKTLGFFYSEDLVKFDNVAEGIPYTSFGGSFIDQVTPTFFVNATIAAAPSTYGTSKTIWSMSGYVDVQKRFERSTVSLAYSRGLSLNQYNSQYLTDRADFSYTIQLTQRTTAGAGIGYQRVFGPPLYSGEYGSATVGYQLLPSVAISAVYLYGNQTGDNVQIYSEKQSSAFVAVSWAPPHLIP